ncbi:MULTISPECIES: ABC transporter ATP-binding protein [Roseobacteraceae]|uniref:Oligopeptide transport ATP-binding protein OppF n=1 Tax=Pseudosulfitobacter pseudonitzschiae TaxID=1402135 RepID=A0A221K6L9_9RHOB|nr:MULTISPECIES: ABC transporter ATP-binding protein [Roseobacteraceae]ASM74513.1 oligopeptide transport ATP-binding protein OppF [Pseudosulfitobacter pseudonitzschiae]
MSEPLVKIQTLSKRFYTPGGLLKKPRSMLAVRDVSLSIARGDIVGVVGESGCGKSTFARLVLRLIDPTDGSVCFEGADLTKLRRRDLRKMRQRMAMVFQDPYSSLDPRYRVADALAEPFVVQGDRVPNGRIADLLTKVGLPTSMAQSYPHQLSGGQRQRVGIARALALNPDFIVLDEPTASLDVSIQAQIISLIQQLQRDLDLTYLFISHDLGLVRYFCNRIVVMYLGAVVEELPDPQAAPRHPYTHALMASTFAPDPTNRQDTTELTGEIPSGFDLPPGCAFAARCPNVTARCRESVPVLSEGPHPVACFHPL